MSLRREKWDEQLSKILNVSEIVQKMLHAMDFPSLVHKLLCRAWSLPGTHSSTMIAETHAGLNQNPCPMILSFKDKCFHTPCNMELNYFILILFEYASTKTRSKVIMFLIHTTLKSKQFNKLKTKTNYQSKNNLNCQELLIVLKSRFDACARLWCGLVLIVCAFSNLLDWSSFFFFLPRFWLLQSLHPAVQSDVWPRVHLGRRSSCAY